MQMALVKNRKLLVFKVTSVIAVLHTSLQYFQWIFFDHKVLCLDLKKCIYLFFQYNS